MEKKFWDNIRYEDDIPSSIYIMQNISCFNNAAETENKSRLNIDSYDECLDDRINTFSSYINIGNNKNNYVNSDYFKKT